MIILDYSQIMIATMMAYMREQDVKTVEEVFVRHLALNTIRFNYNKFKREFGPQLVIAVDDDSNWRKAQFPYYKANRAEEKAKLGYDWDSIYAHMATMKSELEEFFPYVVLKIEGAEADDIIGTLVNEFGADFGAAEPILIISGDKDFRQLHHFSNVQQWHPVEKKMIAVPSATEYLQEHIIKGDSGDGIPSILSQDDCFVLKVRQKPMTEKRLTDFKTKSITEMDEITRKRFERNTKLIDLRNTPDPIKKEILYNYNHYPKKNRSRIFNYFVDKRLKNLLDAIGEF